MGGARPSRAASMAGAGDEVVSSPYGEPDGMVALSNGLLAVRFDPPFSAPYTITGISFPTVTQFRDPTKSAKFISVRVLGIDPGTGLPDKAVEHYQMRGVACSTHGEMNTLPLEIRGIPGQTFFVVFQFPRPPASADTFPFLFTDRNPTDRGLFARSFATDTNAVAKVPLVPGTLGRTIECLVDSTNIVRRASGSFLADRVKAGDVVGGVASGTYVLRVDDDELEVSQPIPAAKTTGPHEPISTMLGFLEARTLGLLVDQNILCSMSFRSQGDVPPLAPTALGLELDSGQVRWRFRTHPEALADGTPAPSNHLIGTELVRRDRDGWTAVAHAGGGVDWITRGSVPGDGLQVWGVRSVARGGQRSEVSTVTISGSANLQGYALAVGEDAQEPNSSPSLVNATPASPSTVPLHNSIWPAGDVDDFRLQASAGQDITVVVTLPVGAYDFRNDLIPRIRLLSSNGELLAEATGNGDPRLPVTLEYRQPDGGNRAAARPFFVEVSDSPPGSSDCTRVLVPGDYELTVDVTGPSLLATAAGRPKDPWGSGVGFVFSVGSSPDEGIVDFHYSIPPGNDTSVPVRLRIYDVSGRLVDTPIHDRKPAGSYRLVWSGRNAGGERLKSGLFFARLEAGAHVETMRVVLVH